MLHRNDAAGLLLISQPSHAWLSGQLASSWGNREFGFDRAGPELRIAAEQHDIAWLDWEAHPTLNRDTGLPYTFSQLPTSEHLEVWSKATSRALSYGRLPALLISMHGTYLYEQFHDFESDTSEEARAARSFLKRELEVQERFQAALAHRSDISHQSIIYQRRLISLWDAMSLALCMGIQEDREFRDVPASNTDRTIVVGPVAAANDTFTVTPWPFVGDRVELYCEGRRLEGKFEDEAAMRTAIADAASEAFRVALVRES